jgi:hypothetical protein
VASAGSVPSAFPAPPLAEALPVSGSPPSLAMFVVMLGMPLTVFGGCWNVPWPPKAPVVSTSMGTCRHWRWPGVTLVGAPLLSGFLGPFQRSCPSLRGEVPGLHLHALSGQPAAVSACGSVRSYLAAAPEEADVGHQMLARPQIKRPAAGTKLSACPTLVKVLVSSYSGELSRGQRQILVH